MDVPERVVLDRLVSWPEHPIESIKYFSGAAQYTSEFNSPRVEPTEGLLLDLGRVEALAEVILNGRNLGVLWKPPFRVDVSRLVRPGKNKLEVRVAGTWLNRLVGEKRHPQGFPGGNNTLQFKPCLAADVSGQLGENLAPSGLIGPVRLISSRRIEFGVKPGAAK
jgi:hypothetical protein